MRRVLLLLLVPLALAACRQPVKVDKVSTQALPIDASLDAIRDSAYLAGIEPIRAEVERQMNIPIGYAAETLWVRPPECPMLNWASDALWEAAKQVYPGKVDMAVVNIGGMRRDWPKGPITKGQVYELMPFENILVVLTLRGADIYDLCQTFANDGGQGVAGLRMQARDGIVTEVTIDGQPVLTDQEYTVATNNYLAEGGDHMTALTRATKTWRSDRLIRDIYLDAVMTHDTIRAAIDGRMDIK